jgi:hypothetical protein
MNVAVFVCPVCQGLGAFVPESMRLLRNWDRLSAKRCDPCGGIGKVWRDDRTGAPMPRPFVDEGPLYLAILVDPTASTPPNCRCVIRKSS